MRDIEILRRGFICIRVSDGIVFGFHNRKDADCLRISTRNQLEVAVTTLRKAA